MHDIPVRLGGVTETVTVTSRDVPSAEKPSGLPKLRKAPTCEATTAGGRPVGGAILPPIKVRHAWPAYPPQLRDAGIEGSVRVEGTIGADGRVKEQDLRVVATAHGLFSQAAVAAMTEWLFDPVYLNCRPQAMTMTVDIHFVR